MATKTIVYKDIRLNSPIKYQTIPISLNLDKVSKPTVSISSISLSSSSSSSSPSSSSLSTFSRNSEEKDDFGICEECGQQNSSKNYCSPCFSLHFQKYFDKWRSGNDDIDRLIKSSQTSNSKQRASIEWIPYDDLYDVKYISKGSFSTIYSAYWSKGPIISWDRSRDDWNRNGEIKVALKRLYNSQNISRDFLYEFEVSLLHCSGNQHKEIMPIYGMTRDPITRDYMIVMKFIEQGNLRNFIYNNFSSLSWLQKLELLQSIAIGLDKIHSSGLSHNDFHSANILVTNEKTLSIIISDLGISSPADKSDDTFGVIQYTPPEILRGHVYTKYSDIYFFAMLMYEISAGVPPFINVSRDRFNDLIFDICDGLRPKYNSRDIPESFVKIMKQCWNDDEFSRPLTPQLIEILGNWIKEIKENKNNSVSICRKQISLKYPLYKYDAYKRQKIKTTDLGEEDFDHDDESYIDEKDDSDEDIEMSSEFERKAQNFLAQNKFVTLKRSDLAKWLENAKDFFDPNHLYPR